MNCDTLSRRSFLKGGIFGSGLSFIPSPYKSLFSSDTHGGAKITGMEIIVVEVNELGNWDFVRMRTNEGVSGIGEASYPGRDAQKANALHDIFPLIDGKSPFDIEGLRQRFYEKGSRQAGPLHAAFCAVEQAMWDICGKMLGAPVADMLGGRFHTSLRTYANINRATRGNDRTPEGFARNARRAIDLGYTAVKAAPFDYMPKPEAGRSLGEWRRLAANGVECIKAIRNEIGRDKDLLIDVHSKFNREFGIEMGHTLAEYQLFWYEEPVNPQLFPDDLASINKESPLPLAGGEFIWGTQGFFNLFKADALDISMPDVKYCGGILELKKIAAISEAAGKNCAPHSPAGPISTASSVQVCATLPNFLILEYAWGEVSWRYELIDPPEEFRNGYLPVSDRPGLGIEFNERVLQKYRIKI